MAVDHMPLLRSRDQTTSRGWTWVDVHKLFWPDGYDEYHDKCLNSDWTKSCPLSRPETIDQMAGLIWIGGAFYKTPEDFLSEAREQGISRRISTVPKAFKPGKTWVLLAHRKVIKGCSEPPPGSGDLVFTPAIFSVFKPQAVEYVTKGDETQEELERIVKRGLTPVEVNPRRAYR